MTSIARRRPRAVLRRALIALMLATLVLAPVGIALLALERAPLVAEAGPPDAAAVARTRDLAERVRDLIASDGAQDTLSASEAELEAAIASGRRIVRGLAGRTLVDQGGVTLELTVGAPHLPAGWWLNVQASAEASEYGLRLGPARVGRLVLPPALVRLGTRLALDRLLGDGLGTAAIASVEALRTAPPEATVIFAEDGRTALFARLRDRARAGSGDAERTYVHLWWLDRIARDGGLPREGSVLPYLAHAVAKSAELAEGPARGELKAAILALTLYCGDHRVAVAVGARLSDHMRGEGNACDGTTLAGRDDLKRHFVISAGVYAASTDQAVLGVGELKELLDSNAGGTGFSFDDLAADLAGARFAAAFLEAPPEEWADMLARISGEADILPDLAGLPTGLDEAAFRARYGDVDSPAYRALLAEIERRIDALPLYRRPVPSN